MNIRQSVYGEVAIRSGTNVTGVELGALLRRLLLFDTVVIKSVRLREIPFLVRAFGQAGFSQLLDSGVLKLSCEFTVIAGEFLRNGIRSLPLFHFSLGLVDIADRDNVLKSELRCLQSVHGLKNAPRAALEEVILTKLIRPPVEYRNQLLTQSESDLRANTPALATAITQQLRTQLGGATRHFKLSVEETQNRVFHVATDLSEVFGISAEKAHDIVQSGVFAVCNLNQRIADMAAYSAITGFAESEAPLLFHKFANIIGPLNPKPAEEQFARIVTIANLPEFMPGKKVDVGLLLKARESPECREFRAYIAGLDDISDQQIAEMIRGVRSRVAFMMQSNLGRVLRLAATTAIGFIPVIGAIGGAITGTLDSFLIDRIFPNSGVVAFLTKTYPSLFKSP
jgi:hypothetical protein